MSNQSKRERPLSGEAVTSPVSSAAQRDDVDFSRGLSARQVTRRVEAGDVNKLPEGNTPTVADVIRRHVLTLFNLINLALAAAVIFVGSPRNALFLGLAVVNTVMGIAQELRAKATLDKLDVLSRSKVTVLREGQPVKVDLDELVLDDLVYLKAGSQVYADGVVIVAEGLEVDESLLTGEADRLKKLPGDALLSGSFLTAGTGMMQLTAVGVNSYANALTAKAKSLKRPTTPLMRMLNNIIRALTIAIVPIGGLLFYTQRQNHDLTSSVLSTTASMIGMIPEGLILLTSVTLTVGALRLARKKALVQSLHSIETLARVDVLCLDKTGTITDGTMSLTKIESAAGYPADAVRQAVSELMYALSDENPTATALRAELCEGGKAAWRMRSLVPFSSARKWSGASFEGRGSYVLGAPAFVLPPSEQAAYYELIRRYTKDGMRVLALGHSEASLGEDSLPFGLICAGFLILSDTVRPEAVDTFRFFRNEGVTLKVISGDDPEAVSAVAMLAGIDDVDKYVDMSQYGEDDDFLELVRKNTVFGRVSPTQKKALVAALKAQGHTVCMTGDGVNDVLAMKEADCSVSMVSGSDAARNASEFVLMTGDFSAMIEVLKEGRRVINNIEGVAALYLVKTIYSLILGLSYCFIPFPYPFLPAQMMPVNGLTVGAPSFVLALRNNFARPRGQFFANVMQYSLPGAIAVVANALIIQLAGLLFEIPHSSTSSMTVLLTGLVGFLVLYKLSDSNKLWLKVFIGVMGVVFVLCTLPIPVPVFGPMSEFFMLEGIWMRNIFFWVPLTALSFLTFQFLNRLVILAREKLAVWRQRKPKQ